MRHEKVIIKPDKSKVMVTVRFYEDTFRGGVYLVDIKVCPLGKRKFVDVSDHDYAWRSLSAVDRDKRDLSNMLQHVTADEIYSAKIELWEKLKPTE